MIALEPTAENVIIPVRVHASARRTGVAGEHAGALRVEVAPAPEKGKANRAVAEVLADTFGVAKSAVALVAGATSPQKRFLVRGCDETAARRSLAAMQAE